MSGDAACRHGCNKLPLSRLLPASRTIPSELGSTRVWMARLAPVPESDPQAQVHQAAISPLVRISGTLRRARPLESDSTGLKRTLAVSFCLSMIFAENRFPLFR